MISIHALRVEGDMVIEAVNAGLAQISIHALRVEGDMYKADDCGLRGISIHALRVEGDRLCID